MSSVSTTPVESAAQEALAAEELKEDISALQLRLSAPLPSPKAAVVLPQPLCTLLRRRANQNKAETYLHATRSLTGVNEVMGRSSVMGLGEVRKKASVSRG